MQLRNKDRLPKFSIDLTGKSGWEKGLAEQERVKYAQKRDKGDFLISVMTVPLSEVM